MTEEVKIVEPEVVEKKSKKTHFLPADQRQELIDQLDEYGISHKGLDDLALIKAVRDYAAQMHNETISKDSDRLGKSLNYYASQSHLTNKELIKALYELNVPNYYLPIFTDLDVNLLSTKKEKRFAMKDGKSIEIEMDVINGKKIWEKINKSGIKFYKNHRDCFKNR